MICDSLTSDKKKNSLVVWRLSLLVPPYNM